MDNQAELMPGSLDTTEGLVKPSCLIGCIGQYFMDGTIEAMCRNAAVAAYCGVNVQVEIIHDISIEPNGGVNMMRNFACMEAVANHADYLLMLDNDFLMEDPFLLISLVRAGKHIVAPYYDQHPVKGREFERVANPMYRAGQGVQPIRWVSFNCVLFDTLVFRAAGTQLFTGPLITNHEEYIGLNLRNHGVRMWMDTNHSVKMLREPTRVWANRGQDNPNPASDENRELMADLSRRVDEEMGRARSWVEAKIKEEQVAQNNH